MKKNGISYRVLMLFISNSVLQLMGFGYRIALSREAGALALGLNSLVMQLYGVVVSICISGLNVAVAALSARMEKERIGCLLFNALAVLLVLWLSAAFPMFVLRKRLAEGLLGYKGLSQTLTLMLVCILMTGIENVLKSIHLGTKNVTRCAVSEVIEQGVRFALVMILLRKLYRPDDTMTVFIIMLGMTLSELVSVSVLTISYLSIFGIKTPVRPDITILKRLSAVAFPAIMTAVSSTMFASVGTLVLPAMLIRSGLVRETALSEIGILNTALVPVSMLPMAFVGAVASVVMPEISEKASRNEDPSAIIIRSFSAVTAIGALSTAALICFADDIIQELFSCEVDRGIMLLILIKAFIVFLQAISVSVLNGMMKQKKVFLFALIGESYQLALIFLLSPAMGMTGYVLSTISGELLRLALNAFEIYDALKNCGNCISDMLKLNGTKTLRGSYVTKREKARMPFRLRDRAEIPYTQGEDCPRGRIEA